MLDISTELKELYKSNNVPKYYDIYIPLLDLHINSHGANDKIVHGSFELKESLGSDKDLRFGSCEASEIKFVVADISHDLKGQEITIDQYISEHVVPFGKYKIDSCKKQDDLRYKEIIAYDKLADIDIDVSEWYNSLFPTGVETYTLKKFRSLLLAHLGIEEIDQALPNDDMVVEKTIDPTQISGRVVLEATVELNGAFGHINRDGKFTRKVLQPSYGLYPSETLYPSEDIYPVSEADTTYAHESIIDENVSKAMYQSVRFEEYTVKEFDKLQIRAEENDIGAIVGTGTNTYVIEGNFLVFGKSASELEQIALNIYGNIAKRPYRPFEAQSIGLPYVEVGDSLEIATDDVVVGYVLQRTLTGIQALRDTYTAKGNEEREQNFGVNKEIIQLQGRTAVLKRNVDEVSNTLTNLAEDTESRFIQTAEQISLAVGDLDEQLTGELNVLAGQVVLKVDANGNIGYIDLIGDPDTELTSIKLKADNLSLEGLTTINSKFKVLADGTIEAVDAKFSGTITGSIIRGSAIETYGNDGYVKSTSWDGATYGVYQNDIEIKNGILRCSRTLYTSGGPTFNWATTINYDTVNTKKIVCETINGSPPVVASNFVPWDTFLPLYNNLNERVSILEGN